MRVPDAPLLPGGLPLLQPQDTVRSDQVLKWAKFHQKIAETIPRAVAKGDTLPYVFSPKSVKPVYYEYDDDDGFITDKSQRQVATKMRADQEVDTFRGPRPSNPRIPSAYILVHSAMFNSNYLTNFTASTSASKKRKGVFLTSILSCLS